MDYERHKAFITDFRELASRHGLDGVRFQVGQDKNFEVICFIEEPSNVGVISLNRSDESGE